MTIRVIGIRLDYETRSRVPIKFGAYRYCECPDFRVLVAGYSPIRLHPGGAITLGRPRTLDLSDPTAVAAFHDRLLDPGFQKHAFNANFERIVSSRWVGLPDGEYIDPEGWYCTAVKSNVNGIFGTLDDVAKALKTQVLKDRAGKDLIRFFTIPDHKTGVFNEAADHPTRMREFERYCEQDVVVEAVIDKALPPIPAMQQAEYEADQRINDRGFRHFKGLSLAAVQQVKVHRDTVMDDLRNLTGVDNPNSGQQMKGWLEEQGYPMGSLAKDPREEALRDPFVPDVVAQVLTLKGQASLTSVQKHQAALDTRCNDGRIRGSLRYYGAHTGREAGRGIQPQNLPRHEATTAERRALVSGNTAGLDVPLVAKGTVRSSIVPARDHLFVVVDYNAIEARTLGWACGEKWVNDEFDPAKGGQGKIYEATSAMMFGVNKDALVQALRTCGKCGACVDCRTRGKGKVSNLALGYAGGAGALVTMGAEREGIDCGNYVDLHHMWEMAGKPGKFHEWERDLHDYPELKRLRDLYRDASPQTVRFWKLCAKAWDLACTGKGARFGANGVVAMVRDGRHNRLVLPSGRSIWYRFARMHFDPNRPEYIDRRTFMGKSQGVGHVRTDTHGGKLTENINQAIARDVLFDLIMKIEALTAQGWPGRLVLHVHDEVVLEVHKRHADQVLADTIGMTSIAPDWAPGLAVKGEGDIMERYRK